MINTWKRYIVSIADIFVKVTQENLQVMKDPFWSKTTQISVMSYQWPNI